MSEDVVVERTMVIPLRDAYRGPRYKRAERAIRIIRSEVQRRFKPKGASVERIVIDPKLNELIWRRGIRHPPRKVTVVIQLDKDGIALVKPAE